MRTAAILLFALLALNGAHAKSCGSAVTPSSFGVPNLQPIFEATDGMTLQATVSNGKLYTVNVPQLGGNTSSTFNVIHLYGTPYDWGYAQGSLIKDEVNTFITDAWTYMESQVSSVLPGVFPSWLDELIADVGLDVALDLTYEASKEFTNPDFYAEMQGLSDASGVDYMKIVRIHMIAGLTQGACSMMGAWGEALGPGSDLIQLRALDWDMDGPFRDYSQITVYHPINSTYGHAFANVGFSGFVGGLTGMSETQLGISEIGVTFPDSTFGKMSRIGVPFIFLLRDILNYDYSLDDAENRMINAHRTCDLILGVGDGKLPEFRGFEYSYSVLDVIDDQNLRPANETWHPIIDDVVYWGMDWDCPSFNEVLADSINANYGNITAVRGASHISAVEMSGSNHVAYYDLTNMELLVSFAAPSTSGGDENAYARQYSHFNVTSLFVEPAPGAARIV